MKKQHLVPIAPPADRLALSALGPSSPGMSTGYEHLDAKTGGLHRGELVVVLAKPQTGLTAFGLGLAFNVASPSQGEPDVAGPGVLYASLDMPMEVAKQRMVAAEARVPMSKLHRGRVLGAEEAHALSEAEACVSELPIYFGRRAFTLLQVDQEIRRCQAEYAQAAATPERRIGMMVIDVFQNMQGPEGKNLLGLKLIAGTRDIAIVVLSSDARMAQHDMQMERHVDLVLGLEVHDVTRPISPRLDIRKQRNGPLGEVKLRFDPACLRFDNPEPGV